MDSRSGAAARINERGHRFAPIVENRPARPVGRTIRVVAFNARGGRYLAGIAECLRRPPLADADVILLSEANWNHPHSAFQEFAAALARVLDRSFAYLPEFAIPVERGEPNALLGNAILCTTPLEAVYAAPISNRNVNRRLRKLIGGPAGLVARAYFRGKPITLSIVHLNSRWDPAGRERQMSEYLARLSDDGPAIVGGDLNTTTVGLYPWTTFPHACARLLLQPRRLSDPRSWETLFARMELAGFKTEGANLPGKRTFTFSRLLPTFLRPNLDWIALRGLEPVAGSAAVVPARPGFFARRVSDHDFITCDVKI
jgi:endonuclease/exonuclease/phosphatase family metal-dependent hydrolase